MTEQVRLDLVTLLPKGRWQNVDTNQHMVYRCYNTIIRDWPKLAEWLQEEYGATVNAREDFISGAWLYIQFPSQQELVRFTLTWG